MLVQSVNGANADVDGDAFWACLEGKMMSVFDAQYLEAAEG